MALQIAAQTQHFIVRFDNSIGLAAPAVANAVRNICEVDLSKLTVFMPSHSGGLADPFLHPRLIDVQIVNNTLTGPGFGGGMNNGYSPGRVSVIQINPFSALNTQITDDYAGFVFVAEMSELLMSFYGWDAGFTKAKRCRASWRKRSIPPRRPISSIFGSAGHGRGPIRLAETSRQSTPCSGAATFELIAFGCGMIFIYFLRYQLNFSYDQICGAGGTLLSDRYRNLTGATDDPAARVRKLLDDHFGTLKINLVGNNPFPLLDGADRKAFLAFGKDSVTRFRLHESGHASIQPFITCPVGDYPYTEFGSFVTQSIIATTLGIGVPVFTWRINGKLLSGSSTGETVSVTVDVPDPQNPGQPSRQTEDFAFDYSVSSSFGVAGGSSTLTLTSRSIDGDYQFDVKVEADETAVPIRRHLGDAGRDDAYALDRLWRHL